LGKPLLIAELKQVPVLDTAATATAQSADPPNAMTIHRTPLSPPARSRDFANAAL
jgi:hypothetical protein